MATPVSWSYGPWRTQSQPTADPAVDRRTNPYANIAPPPFDQGEGGGRGGKGITGTAESGPLTMSELGGLWGGSAVQKGVGLGIGALTGATPSLSSFASLAPKGMVTVASLMSSLFGGVRETDPEFGIPTAVDIQDTMDYGGQIKGQAQAREAAARRESVRSMMSELAGVNQPGWDATPTEQDTQDPGWGGWGGATTPGPSAEAQGYEGGYADPGGSGGPDGGSPDGGNGGGVSSAGDGEGGMRRRGGVDVIRRPTTLQFGETTDAQPETVVSIPRSMFRRGRQQNEPEVMLAMKRLLRELRG